MVTIDSSVFNFNLVRGGARQLFVMSHHHDGLACCTKSSNSRNTVAAVLNPSYRWVHQPEAAADRWPVRGR